MANTELAMTGLRPLGLAAGRVRIGYYQINTALNLFRFQPMVMNNSGQATTISLTADNSGILGSLIGFLDPNYASLPSNMTSLSQAAYLSSLNTGIAAIADDPDQLFISEMDTGGTIVGSANSSGQSIRLTYTATTGNTTTGISNAVLDQSTVANNTAGVIQLVRPYNEFVNADGTVNDVTLNFSKWVVKINKHQNGPWGINSPTDKPS